MRLLKTLCLAVLLFTCTPYGSAQSPSIYGAYQNCPFHCETIKINQNFTFEYRLYGDLFNDERVKGQWRFIGKNKMKATTPYDHSPLQVIEKITNRSNGFFITALDSHGALISGAKISGVTNGSAFRQLTDQEGVAQIPVWKLPRRF